MAEKPPDEHSPSDHPAAPPESERRPRRASPLGLMGPQQWEQPRPSPLPSLRAAGIMVAFMAAVVLLLVLISRGC